MRSFSPVKYQIYAASYNTLDFFFLENMKSKDYAK